MMTLYWLQFLGLLYIAFGVAMCLNPKAIKKAIDELPHNRAAMFNLSLVNVIIGAAIITVHNFWGSVAESIVSLFGWMALAKGVIYLTHPEWVEKFKPHFKKEAGVRSIGFFCVIVGGIMLSIGAMWL